MVDKTSSNRLPLDYEHTNRFFTVQSDIELVANTIILDPVNPEAPHSFVGVQFFTDDTGDTQVQPGAGTVEVTVETINSQGVWETVPSSTIDATAPTTVNWGANTKRVRLAPTGITTATHWRAIYTANLS